MSISYNQSINKANQGTIEKEQMIKSVDCSNERLQFSPPLFANSQHFNNKKEENGYTSLLLKPKQSNNININNPNQTNQTQNKDTAINKVNSTQYRHNHTNSNDVNNTHLSYINSSTDYYWQKRENQKQEKLNQILKERIQKEQRELRDRPMISKNSSIMANRIRSRSNEKVFDRLNSENQKVKKEEKKKQIERETSKNHPPEINKRSYNIKRTVDDLFQWKAQIEKKKNKTINDFISVYNKPNPQISEGSTEILKQRKPTYLNMKVEDRLIEQGERSKKKIEEQKEKYIEKIIGNKKDNKINKRIKSEENPKSNYYANIESRYNKEEYNKGKRKSKAKSNRDDNKEGPIMIKSNYNNNNNNSINYAKKTNCVSYDGNNQNSEIRLKKGNSNSKFIINKNDRKNVNRTFDDIGNINDEHCYNINTNAKVNVNLLKDIRKQLNEYYNRKRKEINKSFTANAPKLIQKENMINNNNNKKFKAQSELNEEILQDDKINKKIPIIEPFEKNYQNYEHVKGVYNSEKINSNDKKENIKVPLSHLTSKQNKTELTYQYQPLKDNQFSIGESLLPKSKEDITSKQKEIKSEEFSIGLLNNNNNNTMINNNIIERQNITFKEPFELGISKVKGNNINEIKSNILKINDYNNSVPQYNFNKDIIPTFSRAKNEPYKQIPQKCTSSFKDNNYYPLISQNEKEYTINYNSNLLNFTNQNREISSSQITNSRMEDLHQMENFISNLGNNRNSNTKLNINSYTDKNETKSSEKKNITPMQNRNLYFNPNQTQDTNKNPNSYNSNVNFNYFNYYQNKTQNHINNNYNYNNINYFNQKLKSNEEKKNILFKKLDKY